MRVAAPCGRDAEELLDVTAGEEGSVELFELADGVWDGEEPPGLGRHPRSWSTRCARVGWDDFQRAWSFDRLVEGFTECKIRVPSFQGPIKGVMGR